MEEQPFFVPARYRAARAALKPCCYCGQSVSGQPHLHIPHPVTGGVWSHILCGPTFRNLRVAVRHLRYIRIR